MDESEGHLFTPRHAQTDVRLRMVVSRDDIRKIGRGDPWRATVTDLASGKRFRTWGASCGQPRCFCDAIAIELED